MALVEVDVFVDQLVDAFPVLDDADRQSGYKTFSLSLTKRHNKLESFFLAVLSSLNLWVKPVPTQVPGAPSLPTNIKPISLVLLR